MFFIGGFIFVAYEGEFMKGRLGKRIWKTMDWMMSFFSYVLNAFVGFVMLCRRGGGK